MDWVVSGIQRFQGLLFIAYNSPYFVQISEIANRAYLGGGQQARNFIIKKLDNYMRDQAWTHLLAGIKPDEISRLRELLAPDYDNNDDHL